MTTNTIETKTTKKVPASACWMRDAVRFELLAGGDGPAADGSDDGQAPKGKREWSMLANTGAAMNRFWGQLVLDLDGAKLKQRLGLLLDHDTAQRIGYSTKVERTDRGIEASGKLLRNAIADQVLSESAEGFPFQASLMAVPSRVQELDEGEEAEVNGKTMQGPLTIFREWSLRELTLTVLGADADTETQAFADGGELEVELTMTTKTKPGTPADGQVAPENTPQPQAPALSPNPEQLAAERKQATSDERKRCAEILGHCSPEQLELGNELIRADVPLEEALSRIIRDTRERVSPPRGSGTEPQTLGNRSDPDRDELTQLRALPEGRPELLVAKHEKLFVADPRLAREFEGNKDVYLSFVKNRHRCRDASLQLNQETGELLSGALPGISFRQIKGQYFWEIEWRTRALWTTACASDMASDQPYEIYKWLGGVPAMEKWAGTRRRQQLSDFQLTVLNDKYENTIEVDIDDARRDKTGQIDMRIGELGGEAAVLPQTILTTLLEANGNGYDGAAFFANSHNHGGTVDNLLGASAVAPDAPTSAEMVTAILASIQELFGYTNDRGKPCNQAAMRFAVVVPTKYWAAATAAIGNEFTSAGVSNTLMALREKGITIDVYVNPLLTGTAAAAGRRFYTFRVDAPVRALIWQEEAINDAFKTLGPDSSDGFWNDTMAFGGKRIGAGALGRFELANRTEFS